MTAPNNSTDNSTVSGNNEGKYLTFILGNENYGIAITKVKEIIGIMDITEVPDTPEFAKGVINLRDKVIPIIDLRLKFHLEAQEYDSRTCIIVAEITHAEEKTQIGIIVDSVSEVLSVSASEIDPPPDFGTQVGNSFILGLAKIDKQVKILLDIDKVLTSEDVAVLG